MHSGSSKLAHNLDRFSPVRNPEPLIVLAAILGVETQMVEEYVDLFGDDVMLVERRVLVSRCPRQYSIERLTMPAYEAQLRAHVDEHLLRILH